MPMNQFDSGFGLFELFFFIILIVFVIVIGKNVAEWASNNSSPLLTVAACVVSKRSKVSGGAGDSAASTTYFVTFELEGGERKELKVKGREYGQLAEGDTGSLSFQGTRYIEFQRMGAKQSMLRDDYR